MFPTPDALESVALLPLTRQERLIGCLNFGSRERERFLSVLGTDFLHHLAVIAAFSLESAVNRARLVRSGFTDALTGWHNRRYLQSRLQEELARCRRERTPLTCLMIDVDHFKKINDTHGHLAGDAVLKGVVATVRERLRPGDVLCRTGGEEFALILPNTPEPASRHIAETARAAIEACEYSFDGTRILVTLSLGVALLSGADVPETFHQRADEALYAAKRGGRNRVA